MYHLSDEIWGEKAKEAIAAAASQKDSSLTKSKRGQATKEKVDGNSKGETVKEATNQNIDTQRGNEKDQSVVVETVRNVKRKLSREDTATATHNGDTLVNGKGGKTENDASTGNQNGGVGTTEETDEEDAEREVINVRGTPRSFDELQNLYPGLAECVERIKAQHQCGETLRTAFGFIDDEMANALESNIKEQRIVKAKIQIDQWDIKMEVLGKAVLSDWAYD
ncbi:hypothetical protein PR202_ga30205 [Eleusine coracana subsp. coracana]|uniref:Uncharacterized protein n=1 Tax=Eleusine coracana subsp. coracana TaxID=191504 RepID=A0AAV5DQ05_ELECO|nr:hypothetical protein PR202_ga30205 [Eleusine coracana subsp. coracana]